MSSLDEATLAFEKLAAHVRAQGLDVRHSQRRSVNIDAVYKSREQGGPSIEVFRNDLGCADDAWREVALLAHEFGHHVSDLKGWRSEAYFAASKNVAAGHLHFEDEEVFLVLQEECIAWRVARIVLEGLDIEVPAFDEIKRSNLYAYCHWMMVADSWADHIDARICAPNA